MWKFRIIKIDFRNDAFRKWIMNFQVGDDFSTNKNDLLPRFVANNHNFQCQMHSSHKSDQLKNQKREEQNRTKHSSKRQGEGERGDGAGVTKGGCGTHPHHREADVLSGPVFVILNCLITQL